MDVEMSSYEDDYYILRVADWLQDFELAIGVEFPLATHYFLRTASKCACGIVTSFATQFLRFLLFAALQRLIWSFDVRRPFFVKLVDFLVGVLGTVLSWYGRESLEAVLTIFVYFVISTAVIFLVRELNSAWTGHACVLFTLSYTVVCQLYVFDAMTFTSLYGCLMVAAMKQISLAYDSQDWKCDASAARVLEMFAFLFNPATFAFGPFFTFDEFLAARRHIRLSRSWREFFGQLMLIVQLFAMAFIFLVASHCFAEQMLYLIFGPDSIFPNVYSLFPDFVVEFALGYGEALSFRFNHYFVCYLADGLCAATGLRHFDAPLEKSSSAARSKAQPWKASALWRAVEWPHSMSTVVVAWNRPMHNFLKRYIYETMRETLGYFASIVATFAVSAFLHGFNFQLSAVLISLAVYGLVESDFRYRLSQRFSACVESRHCHTHCGHLFKTTNLVVKIVNFLFVALNIFHLAYLGTPFAAPAEESEVGYYWHHTLTVWSHWNFSSPAIVLVMFLTSRLV